LEFLSAARLGVELWFLAPARLDGTDAALWCLVAARLGVTLPTISAVAMINVERMGFSLSLRPRIYAYLGIEPLVVQFR